MGVVKSSAYRRGGTCIHCGAPTEYTLCSSCGSIYRHTPCTNCEERSITCHATCDKYAKWLAINASIKKHEALNKTRRG